MYDKFLVRKLSKYNKNIADNLKSYKLGKIGQ